MPANYYPNKTVEELEVYLVALQNRGTQGQVSFVIAAGMQQQRTFQGAARPEVEIKRVLYALHKLRPETYENPYAGRIRRVEASYL